MNPNIGINIRKIRKSRHISQKELAFRIKKSNGYLSDIENGNKLPSINVLYNIAYHLCICPSNLLGCKNNTCDHCRKFPNEIKDEI
ncbi:helix-turn-helix domain-containing protein [Clostridium guangxiense]|uniref:helix-turn-helix domain-containing protein n=1 Tax=Clostridium guangxiense TaxID=1662055 RepID=UPI001E633A3D|nr:helix-turn-helix transcriptional regulator [Clostridium guangxiense]MCD2345138.1 helix-turn-helix domain-containing protein [Clostridium guangxiense]